MKRKDLCAGQTIRFPAALQRLGRLLGSGENAAQKRAGRWTVRFFAAMLLLTLVSRGMAGAAMARVELTTAGPGTIVQQASASGRVSALEGETVELPAGVNVDLLAVSQGQTLRQGDTILRLNADQLQSSLDTCQVQQARLQAQMDQLLAQSPADTSGVEAAQRSLTEAKQDQQQTDQRSQAAVSQAEADLQAAADAQTQAEDALKALESQTDPAPTDQQLAEARQKAEQAAAQTEQARQALQQAQTDRQDSLLAAQRSLENAQAALDQANTAYSQAQQSAALTAQTNQAEAAALQLDMDKNQSQIQLLQSLLETDGLVVASADTQVLLCTLQQGQPCPEGTALQLAKAGSGLAVEFSLPESQAQMLAAGQQVTVTGKNRSVQAQVQTVAPADDTGSCQITVSLAEDSGLQVGETAQADITFSRTEYISCVPVSAVRQDSIGSYLLTVEQSQTAFGTTNTARRVDVNVLEVDSAGQYAALDSAPNGSIILSSDRAVSPGAAVRIES